MTRFLHTSYSLLSSCLLTLPLLFLGEHANFADAAATCSKYFPAVKDSGNLLSKNAIAGSKGGRRSLRGKTSSDDLRNAFIEATSGPAGRGTLLWELMGEYTEVNLDPELKKEVKATPKSFGSEWRKGVADDLKKEPGKLLPAWCNSLTTCHAPSTTEIVTSVRYNHYKRFTVNSSQAAAQWNIMNDIFIYGICEFAVEGHEEYLLPLFAQAANLHLMVLREGIIKAENYSVWAWQEGNTMQVNKATLLERILTYGGYVDAIYNLGLNKFSALPAEGSVLDCFNATEVWTKRNKYIRYMTFNVMDFRSAWIYMDTTVFPYPGVHVNLKRQIYSDPVGECKYHYQYKYYTRFTETIETDGYGGFAKFVYPDGSGITGGERWRVDYLRATGTDYVRTLQLGWSDGKTGGVRGDVRGSTNAGSEAFTLQGSDLLYNPIYSISVKVAYMKKTVDSNYWGGYSKSESWTYNHLQYIIFKQANGTDMYINTAEGGDVGDFTLLKESSVGAVTDRPGEDNGFSFDYMKEYSISYPGHVLADVFVTGQNAPKLDGINMVVFGMRLEDSLEKPPSPL
ncbi:hypothetical protein CEUSTIGMA_g1528.t1, partial [Chlamydomonas eustigma]